MFALKCLRMHSKCKEKFLQLRKIAYRLYSSEISPSNPILNLEERGMIQEVFPNTSKSKIVSILEKSPQYIYAGFDPTADSLHIGNLLILITLLHWQRAGHKVLIVLGGATGLIGDPSHRAKERLQLDQTSLTKNIEAIQRNITTVFENHSKYLWKNDKDLISPLIVNNIEWYQDVNVITFVRDIGKHFRLGTMLIKDSVQSRLNSETGMSYSEFTYQVFQAYDWFNLLNKYNCIFQIGGSDQLGNIVAGHELISRAAKKDVYALTSPLITAEGGKKFGKSLGNAIWLSAKKSSSFELYQYFMRTKDSDIERFLKFFTFLPCEEINHIVENHMKEPEKHIAQKVLAENVTKLIHGESGLKEAQNASLLLYESSAESLAAMKQSDIINIFKGSRITDVVPESNMTAYNLAMKVKCFKTENDANRIIKAGGFYINYKRVSDSQEIITKDEHILSNKISLLRTGKKTYHIVRWLL